MNEIIKLENPNGNLEKANALCKYINTRKAEVLAVARAITVTKDNYDDPQTKDAIEELNEMVEELRERGKQLVKDVCAATEAQRVLTQIDSRLWNFSTRADPDCAYAKLKLVLDGLKAQVKAFRDADKPTAKPRSWVIRMDATDEQFNAMSKAAKKAGCPFVYFATPQTDKARKVIQQWFDDNE